MRPQSHPAKNSRPAAKRRVPLLHGRRALAVAILLTAPLLVAGAQEAAPPGLSGLSESDIPAPAAVAVPARPVDQPPRPPQVSCSAGQMTISAENSTLDSIFAQLQKCIGVPIDIPGGSDHERTYLHLGPGPTRKVLLAFLESTDFNYVLQPSDSDPTVIRSVLLMARNEGTKDQPTPDDTGLSPTRRAWLDQRRRAALSTRDPSALPDPSADSGDSAETAQTAETAPEPDPSVPAASAAAGAPDPAASAAPPVDPGLPPASSPPPVTTAAATGASTPAPTANNPLQDQITTMQQMFEERRRMAQQQNSAPPSSVQPQ